MAIAFVIPPSLGPARATARAELIEAAISRALDEPVKVRVASSYAEPADYRQLRLARIRNAAGSRRSAPPPPMRAPSRLPKAR